MDHESLRTATTYLNNLLLARGLLRNGEPIDFVKPGRDARAQIINLVHDLVLRQDRGREQREEIAETLRHLHSEDGRKQAALDRLKEKSEADARAAAQARVAQNAAEAELKAAERTIKRLQDQTARLKANLTQTRTLCQNDIRKRDVELARLKSHLQQHRSGRAAPPTMTITGGTAKTTQPLPDVHSAEYSLKQETTEFLTQLSQSLSEENDSLMRAVRNALVTTRELLGVAVVPQPSEHTTLEAELEQSLSELKVMLSNPNFVTLDEVEVRDEEIARLREGWEKMEARWRDVVAMMDGWRKKVGTGDTIKLEDLRLGMGMIQPPDQKKVEENSLESSVMDIESTSPPASPGADSGSDTETEKSMSIEEKLLQAQKEAAEGAITDEDDDILGVLKTQSPVRKTNIKGKPKRRSTLSREELAQLLG